MGTYIAIIAFLLAAAILVAAYERRARKGQAPGERGQGTPGACEGCAWSGDGCAKGGLGNIRKGEAEYFDDEELDAFRGRLPETYTPEEEAMFAEVLHTMDPGEVRDWMCSLSSRGIRLPRALTREAVILAGTGQ